MTGLLIAFAIAILVPLFVSTWRTSLIGLAVQGILLSAIALEHRALGAVDLAHAIGDLALLRTLVVPAVLYRSMKSRKVLSRNDVIPPNLFSWALAIGIVVVAFRLADTLVPEEGDAQLLVAIAGASFGLGFFVLTAGRDTFSQIIGLLRIENALALFELGQDEESAPVIRLGMSLVLLASVAFYRRFLDAPIAGEWPGHARAAAGPARPPREIL